MFLNSMFDFLVGFRVFWFPKFWFSHFRFNFLIFDAWTSNYRIFDFSNSGVQNHECWICGLHIFYFSEFEFSVCFDISEFVISDFGCLVLEFSIYEFSIYEFQISEFYICFKFGVFQFLVFRTFDFGIFDVWNCCFNHILYLCLFWELFEFIIFDLQTFYVFLFGLRIFEFRI